MIFTTRGWTGAQIVWTHADGSATYSVSGDDANALEVAVALRDWLDDGARPWAAHVSDVVLTVGTDGERHNFLYTYTGTFTSKVPNAAWIARFGDTSQSTPTGALGTCGVIPGTVDWTAFDNVQGERSREGSWRSGHPQLSHRRPGVEFALSQAAAYALSEAQRLASQPRTAYLYDEAAALWRRVTVGAVSLGHPEGDRTFLVGSLEAIGGNYYLTAAASAQALS